MILLCFIGKAFFEGAGGGKKPFLALVTGKFCVLPRIFPSSHALGRVFPE